MTTTSGYTFSDVRYKNFERVGIRFMLRIQRYFDSAYRLGVVRFSLYQGGKLLGEQDYNGYAIVKDLEEKSALGAWEELAEKYIFSVMPIQIDQ